MQLIQFLSVFYVRVRVSNRVMADAIICYFVARKVCLVYVKQRIIAIRVDIFTQDNTKRVKYVCGSNFYDD